MRLKNKFLSQRQSPDDSLLSRRKAISAVAALSAAVAMPAFGREMVERPSSVMREGEDIKQEIYSLNRSGKSRQFTTFDPKTKEKAYLIKPGEKRNLIRYDGTGILSRLWMACSGWFWEYWNPTAAVDPTILKKLILRVYWDGQTYPSIEAPIGDFFGIGLCEYKHYTSRFMGMSSGGFYCYFPMPFSQGIRLEVENMHDTLASSVFLNANYQALDSLPLNTARLHCLFHTGNNPGNEPLTVMKARGKGHFVGCCLSVQARDQNHLSFLESNEYIYIDTDKRGVPDISGTGMEDYFNGGWYFRNGEFNAPMHGVPIKDALRSMVSMYRFHDADAICFDKSIEMEFINPRPPEHLSPFKFSSTAYWYQDEVSKPFFELPDKDALVNMYRMRDSDHQSIP